MNKFKTLGAMAFAVATVAIIACSKEQQSNINQRIQMTTPSPKWPKP